jgi:hypothetical protein
MASLGGLGSHTILQHHQLVSQQAAGLLGLRCNWECRQGESMVVQLACNVHRKMRMRAGATLCHCQQYDMPSSTGKQRQTIAHPLNTEYH